MEEKTDEGRDGLTTTLTDNSWKLIVHEEDNNNNITDTKITSENRYK